MATTECERVWFDRVGSTVDLGHFTDRDFYRVFEELSGQSLVVYWTDDGTSSGTSLFDSTLMPFVSVLIQNSSDARGWSMQYCGGPMVALGREYSVDSYAWETQWDSTNSAWYSAAYRRSDPTDLDGGASTNTSSRIVLSALGKGA